MVVTSAESFPQEEKTEIKKETTRPMMPLWRLIESFLVGEESMFRGRDGSSNSKNKMMNETKDHKANPIRDDDSIVRKQPLNIIRYVIIFFPTHQ